MKLKLFMYEITAVDKAPAFYYFELVCPAILRIQRRSENVGF